MSRVTHFADDDTIAELERQARRIAELEAALREILEFTAAAEDDDPMSHVYVTAAKALGE